ncbi:MAG: YybH family protein [Candidatus Rokuibacteriota bacterium]
MSESRNAPPGEDELRPLREWLTEFQGRVRAVDFKGARPLCAPGLVAFGTLVTAAVGLDQVVEAQWRPIWPKIRDFTIRVAECHGAASADQAWVAAPWDSLGVREDGSTFARPGRPTIILERRDGRWVATHTHVSLAPDQ